MSVEDQDTGDKLREEVDGTLPLENLRRIERVCSEFEATLRAGKGPRIEDYLEQLEGEDRTRLTEELLALEWDQRSKLDSALDLSSEYTERFDPEVVERVRSRRFEAILGLRASHPVAIGAYKILDVLGEGGMGIVYLAEQRGPVRRRVALKLIKLGMDTREVVARFEAERQALALMNHPNVARVYDAGPTADGRPFFVMEHIEGAPLTIYCDRHKLSIQERLELFVQVCEGVTHAHHRGIIHRDLKPSNVLVSTPDARAVAKIIDFGVARATNQRLTEKTIYTEIGRAVGTPAYMSPEQAEMTAEVVDHRTDVYSLGVVLYELLVGELPFDLEVFAKAAYDEILRRIRDEDPPNPSTRWSRLNVERMTELARCRRMNPIALGGALRGDLDWILMKAIEKERERRYQTVVELAADIGRHLKGEPVQAGPPGALYLVRKYILKNRAACAVVVALTLGVLVSVFFAITAWRSAERAAENERLANQRAAENLALADLQRLRTYRAEAIALCPWPPERRAGVEAWIDKAETLLGRLDAHQAELERLRETTLQSDQGIAAPDGTLTTTHTYRFADATIADRHEMVTLLVEELEAFGDPDPARGTVAVVKRRLLIYPSREAFEAAWNEAITSMQNPEECPRYRDIGAIEAIEDLFPIGRDATSGLWEFVHLGAGGRPRRDTKGRLILTDDTGLVLVLIPAGTFFMGAQKGEELGMNHDPNAQRDEGPVHEVTLRPFFIAKYEVRQAVWERVMRWNPSRYQGGSLPVEMVTREECREFSEKLGLGLPSEARWEYACRAGTRNPYHSGNSEEDLAQVAWYIGNSSWRTHPVGSKLPNDFGLHDMHGNVWEWCKDVYDGNFYSKPEAKGPDPVATSGSVVRVRRGGSWLLNARYCRSALRRWSPPSLRLNSFGFRPCRSLR